MVVLQAAIAWHFVTQSYFFDDDWVRFFDAKVSGGFNLGFLGGETIAHFSPGVRFVTLLIQRYATFDFNLALGFLLLCHSVGVVLLQRILRLFVGPVWWTFVVAFAYGISMIFLGSLAWFSGGLLTIPPLTLGLAAIHAHLCWRRTGRRAWLVWSVVAVGGALLFYEKAVLVPVYLLLIDLLLLEPERRVRDCARRILREWRSWSLYGGLIAVYLAVYSTGSHQVSWQAVPLHQMATYLRIAWLDVLVPGLLGVRDTATGGTNASPLDAGNLVHPWVVVGCQLIFLGAVAFSLMRRPRAWRAWLFLGIGFLLNALIVLPRVSALGPAAGYVLRYDVEILPLVAIAFVCAFARPSNQRRVVAVGRPRTRVAAAVSLGLAGYLALTLTADAALMRKWPGRFSREWTHNVRRDIGALRRSGTNPVLLDEQVPSRVVQFWIRIGYNRLSTTLPVFLTGLRFNEVSDHTYRVGPDGHVRRVAFRPAFGGDAPALLRAGRMVVSGAQATPAGRKVCVAASGRWSSVEVRPPRPLRGQPWYLQTTYRTSGSGGLYLFVNRGVPYPPKPDRALPPRPHGGTTITEIGGLPSGVPTFGGLRADLPPGAGVCVQRLVIGSYVPRPASRTR